MSRHAFDILNKVQLPIVAVICGMVFLFFFKTIAYVPTGSMLPTLQIGSLSLYLRDVSDLQYDDIVIFTPPLPTTDDVEFYVKRIIGLPGDCIEIHDGYVFRNGEQLTPDYTLEPTINFDFSLLVVPEGKYFVMGDNRNHSFDSRYFGAISQELIQGKCCFTVNSFLTKVDSL